VSVYLICIFIQHSCNKCRVR